MKDSTQPRVCDCQTSHKSLELDSRSLSDNFSIQCDGQVYFNDLHFDVDEQRGVLKGHWRGVPLLDRVVFPDTIVDVGDVLPQGGYEWVLEFQCVEWPRRAGIAFYAFNMYARRFDDSRLLKRMVRAARDRGLGVFMDAGRQMKIVNHTGCLFGHEQQPERVPHRLRTRSNVHFQ